RPFFLRNRNCEIRYFDLRLSDFLLTPVSSLVAELIMPKQLNIGIIGYGFMGRAHSNAYCRVNQFFEVAYQPALKAVAARTTAKAEAFAKRWGWQRVESDWRKLIESPDIDVI